MTALASEDDTVRLPLEGRGKRVSWRRMLPREHGAYAQLALPLAAALGVSRPTAASACLVIGACAAFTSHEPVVVLLGRRGARVKRETAQTARRWLAAAVTLAIAFGGVALVLSPPARLWAVLPATLTAGAALLMYLRYERTLVGELTACAVLASAAVPTGIAGGMEPGVALTLSALFFAVFALSTVEVRAIAGSPAARGARISVWCAALAILAAVALSHPLLGAAALPVVALLLAARVKRVGAKRLRELGWVLATASLVMAAAAVAALRA